MYQIISESIDVIGMYSQGKFVPKKFRWRDRVYQIEQICTIHNWKDGAVRKRTFSLQAKGSIFQVEFDRDQEDWTLAQVWFEG